MIKQKAYENLEKSQIKRNEDFLRLFGVKGLVGWKESSDLFTKGDIVSILCKNFLARDLENALEEVEKILHKTYRINQFGFDGKGYYSFYPMGVDDKGNEIYQLNKRFPCLQGNIF